MLCKENFHGTIGKCHKKGIWKRQDIPKKEEVTATLEETEKQLEVLQRPKVIDPDAVHNFL